VAFVTGGGSGIGRAIARRLASEGACVVVADRSVESAATVAGEFGGPDVALAVQADVTSAADVADAIRESVLAFGGVDLVVNNAGLSISKPLLETADEDWDLQHYEMAKGSFLVSRAAAAVLGAQDLSGDLVYIATTRAIDGTGVPDADAMMINARRTGPSRVSPVVPAVAACSPHRPLPPCPYRLGHWPTSLSTANITAVESETPVPCRHGRRPACHNPANVHGQRTSCDTTG
jgi:NAD(P)-dependent dehydrogenase (short-subunit alcohol dehydrogenase family)